MDTLFSAYFDAVGYNFFSGWMAIIVILEFFYTLFENWDML